MIASQLDDNLGALGVQLSSHDLAALDEATTPAGVYPNWFVDGLADAPAKEALAR